MTLPDPQIASQATFFEVNARGVALINKLHSGFTQEEESRRFDRHPGWQEEYRRRCHANLTKEEHDLLAAIRRWVREWVKVNFPSNVPPDLPE